MPRTIVLPIGLAFLALACSQAGDDHRVAYGPFDESALAKNVLDPHTSPPPFSEGIFPCSDCHDPDIPVNPKRREMKLAHQDIVLHHNEEERWCLDCHDAADRDQLHLASGELVPFEQSYRLCGQCHGDKYRDWRAGVHGRRTGEWNGEKAYLLCVSCHNSHSPAFQPLKPLPAPIPPRRTP